MLTKITHITLFVHNQDDALTFYKKLGFVLNTDHLFDTTRWLTLNLPGQKELELVLMLAETAQEKELVGKQGGLKPLLSLESNDCQKDYMTLKEAGIHILEQPAEQPWGISMEIEDLYGNRIHICQSKN
jgi:predicted enzyme related to lactoylglutathione lyase